MKIRSFYAAFVVASLMVALPATNAWSATKAEAEEAIAAADAARKQAASVGGEWRDTGKTIKEATGLLDSREYTKAISIADKAKKQGELGYEQAMGQKDVGMANYFKMGGPAKETAAVASAENMITPNLGSVEVMHNGEKVVIKRDHDKEATLPEAFLKTDRGCPPFCVQPIVAAEGVDTIAELELLNYLDQAAKGDDSIVVVDSRTPDWVMRGTIPGSVNVPWNTVSQDSMSGMFGDSGQSQLDGILADQFGATKTDAGWDFGGAKTLVLFCNGIWCAQSSTNIHTLVKLGYPADKLKWYRGGMQDWVSVGLTTVTP